MAATRITGYKAHRPRRKTYIALDNLRDDIWTWDYFSEVRPFDQMWREGKPFWEIAEELKRKPDAVLILAIDRILKGAIKPRPGGVFGKEWRK